MQTQEIDDLHVLATAGGKCKCAPSELSPDLRNLGALIGCVFHAELYCYRDTRTSRCVETFRGSQA